MFKHVWAGILLVITAVLIIPQVLGYSNLTASFYFSECDKSFKYKPGLVDPKFGISSEDFQKDIENASKIWEKTEGKNLFEYDPNAKFSINFVYDERQALNSKITKLKGSLEDKQTEIKPEIADFEKRSAEFKDRLEKLNQSIDYWNDQGGAPEEEYKKLIEEQNSLKTEAEKLNEIAKSLNSSAYAYNLDVKNLNQTIGTFNTALGEKPEEGLYDPQNKKIDIYFNISKNELVHTLAHELGHAIGISHNQNKNSIMYGFTSEKLTLTQEDRESLKEVCKKVSLLDLLKMRLSLYYLYIQHTSTI